MSFPTQLTSKTEELFQIVYPTLKRFPRYEIPNLVAFIKKAFVDALTYLRLAQQVASKRKSYLIEADLSLQTALSCFIISSKNKYISLSFFYIIREKLEEIRIILSKQLKSGKVIE